MVRMDMIHIASILIDKYLHIYNMYKYLSVLKHSYIFTTHRNSGIPTKTWEHLQSNKNETRISQV